MVLGANTIIDTDTFVRRRAGCPAQACTTGPEFIGLKDVGPIKKGFC